jgi:hypothetical protein
MKTDTDKTISVNMKALKSKFDQDSLPFHFLNVGIDCKRQSDAYWRHSNEMRSYNNYMSVPLLIVSSIAGATSVAQLSTVNNASGNSIDQDTLKVTSWVISVFGLTSTMLTAIHRYSNFAEKGESSRHMARSYSRLAQRIENMMSLVASSVTEVYQADFEQFVEDVYKEIESLQQVVSYIPAEILKSRRTKKLLAEQERSPQNFTKIKTINNSRRRNQAGTPENLNEIRVEGEIQEVTELQV